MANPEITLRILSDPIFLIAAAVLAWVVYRLSGVRSRRLRRKRASLRVQARRAESPRERIALMQQWSELGGLKVHQRVTQQRSAREQGQQARATGRPLSANPYRHSLWGAGRLWKLGWKSVDRHIRWIERHRA